MPRHEPLSIQALRAAYLAGERRPADVIGEIQSRSRDCADDNIWIHELDRAELEPYLRHLESVRPETLPLYGIPFAIKDNIDLAGVPTTAACPAYAYTPRESAHVVQRLLAAGAIPVGKTNLDQFATGLVGARSPYGVTRNAYNPAYIAGGSSSGSAVAVAQGLACFALGTDTAGSGRVPASFNNLIGIKPTRGLLSSRGMVPACRSLDCMSIFATDVHAALTVFGVAAGYDALDPYARRTEFAAPATAGFSFGVPRALEFFGDVGAAEQFALAVERLQRIGGVPRAIDLTPFLAAAQLLYSGPWVTERYAAIESFIETQPDALLPVTREIIEPARSRTALEVFKAQYRLQTLKRETDAMLAGVDFIVTPTTGTVYTIDQILADPIRLNSNLGYYTNFMNLLDYAAIAVPVGSIRGGVPFGVTLFGAAFQDAALAGYAARLHALDPARNTACDVAAPALPSVAASGDERFRLVVCGAHMSGLPLNHELVNRGGRLVRMGQTAPCYRLYALSGGPPQRPGLVQVSAQGAAIEIEVWDLPRAAVGEFLAGVPAPLAIGRVILADGTLTSGFVCEAHAVASAQDITVCGGWRAYLATRT